MAKIFSTKWSGRLIEVEMSESTWGTTKARVLVDGEAIAEEEAGGWTGSFAAPIRGRITPMSPEGGAGSGPGAMCGDKRCGFPNRVGATFCAQCGRPLAPQGLPLVVEIDVSGVISNRIACRILIDGDVILNESG